MRVSLTADPVKEIYLAKDILRVIEIRNDGARVATYEINCTVPLLTVAVVLFVADVIIRKIKWADITTIFKKKSNQEAGK